MPVPSSSDPTDAIFVALERAGWRITDAAGRDPEDAIKLEHPDHGVVWVSVEEDLG